MSEFRPILIFGPTAVGKTDLILSLFSGYAEVISADSMQVYRGMDIGTAKPGHEVLQRIPHHLIDVRNPNEQFTAGDFVHAADMLVPAIAARGRIPIISGGTAFYFKNYIFGLPQSPKGDKEIRLQLEAERRELGLQALYEMLMECDPASASRIHPSDSYRILRALEVYRTTGKPLSSYEVPGEPRRDIKPLIIGLFRERADLLSRIEWRVRKMFEKGLPGEVERLLQAGYRANDPGMRGIGYREFFEEDLIPIKDNLQGEDLPHERIIERIVIDSRRYAKRQLTFFRSLPNVIWVHAEDSERVRSLVDEFLM